MYRHKPNKTQPLWGPTQDADVWCPNWKTVQTLQRNFEESLWSPAVVTQRGPLPDAFPLLCHVPRAVTRVPGLHFPASASLPPAPRGTGALTLSLPRKGCWLTSVGVSLGHSFLSLVCSQTEGGESESNTDISEKNELDTCTPYDKALWVRHTFGQAAPELRIWVCKQVNSCYLRL